MLLFKPPGSRGLHLLPHRATAIDSVRVKLDSRMSRMIKIVQIMEISLFSSCRRPARNLSLGFEYLYYHKDSYLRDFPDVHKRNSEQKLYLMLYF